MYSSYGYRCAEVVLREDLQRDVLRLRCFAVAALRQLQRALLRQQQLLRARISRQQQYKEEQQAKEKLQHQQVQRCGNELMRCKMSQLQALFKLLYQDACTNNYSHGQ